MKKKTVWGKSYNSEEEQRNEPEQVILRTAGNGGECGAVQVLGNQIFFYTEQIETEVVMMLNKKLREKDLIHQAQQIMRGLDKPDPIYLRINCPGGFITDGIAACDTIKNCVSDVYTIVEGEACSAATMLSVVGKKRFMTSNSVMLIHQLSSSFWGTFQEFEDEQVNLRLLMKIIKKVYKEHTQVPMKKIDEILKHDLYFDADACLAYGLVDEII